MERIVDFLAEELKQEELTRTRKAGKKARIQKLLKKIASQPSPVPVDFLAEFGD